MHPYNLLLLFIIKYLCLVKIYGLIFEIYKNTKTTSFVSAKNSWPLSWKHQSDQVCVWKKKRTTKLWAMTSTSKFVANCIWTVDRGLFVCFVNTFGWIILVTVCIIFYFGLLNLFVLIFYLELTYCCFKSHIYIYIQYFILISFI